MRVPINNRTIITGFNKAYILPYRRTAFNIIICKPTGRRRLGSSGRRWDDNIRMDLEEIGINMGNWVNSTQERDYWRALVNATMNLRVPLGMRSVSWLFPPVSHSET